MDAEVRFDGNTQPWDADKILQLGVVAALRWSPPCVIFRNFACVWNPVRVLQHVATFPCSRISVHDVYTVWHNLHPPFSKTRREASVSAGTESASMGGEGRARRNILGLLQLHKQAQVVGPRWRYLHFKGATRVVNCYAMNDLSQEQIDVDSY